MVSERALEGKTIVEDTIVRHEACNTVINLERECRKVGVCSLPPRCNLPRDPREAES